MSSRLILPVRSAPWYRRSKEYRSLAQEYVEKARKVKLRADEITKGKKEDLESLPLDELKEARSDLLRVTEVFGSIPFNTARTIFESNLIEGAGLASEGETRNLIEETFPDIPEDYKDYARLFSDSDGLEDIVTKIEPSRDPKSDQIKQSRHRISRSLSKIRK